MTDAIRVDNLVKYFGATKAVNGISFSVKKGEIFGFLGPNGAGKSTTIRCLMGFNKPTSGEVRVLGFDMSTQDYLAKAKIGYLPGNVKLYDKWTGSDHIKFFEKVYGKSTKVDELIKRLDFDVTQKFRHLSSGNKQKLGLILALMHNPKVIIMDEPTVGLDPILQFEIQKILLELRDSGATILISSHNLAEIEKICDRAAIIKNGKLVAIESIKDLSKKRINKIEVKIIGKYDLDDFKKICHEVEVLNDSLILAIGGDINPILHLLSKYHVKEISINHASLEDIFMKYYEKEQA